MLILLTIAALIILCISQIDFRKIYLALKIPGPFPLPILGNALLFYDKSPEEIRRIGEQLFEKYGNIFSAWMGPQFTVTISDRKFVEYVLTSSKFNEKASPYSLLKPWLNDGLLISKGSKWYQRRKIITPAFHFGVLDEYVRVFDRECIVFVEILSKFNSADKVDLSDLIRLCSLDIICESAMGVNVNAQRNSDSEYVNAVDKMMSILNRRCFSIPHRLDLSFKFTSAYREQTNCLKILHSFTDKVIKERRKRLLESSANMDETKSKKTLLDILLQSTIDGKPLTDKEIREEVDTFMVEGHDTIKSALTFCFYAIAKHPEVQRKCFQEIRDVLGDDPMRPVTLKDLNNLRYLDLIIKETLRIFPPIPMLGRRNLKEASIGEYTIPKDTDVLIVTHFLTHNPKLFPEPLEFRPERFLEENSADILAFISHFPFGAGLRSCIGHKYAILEMKAVITRILRHFDVSLAEESKAFPLLTYEIVLTSKEKIYFHLQPRLY
ncbi:cytochrome P450 4d1-like [Bradysia coprophila]|uniref:cytochrome P450 4d1-like n=1 Tax=Bradysia coprophila TaxID=38358 RepID=UPI00187DA51B|nr:cytochrome P450 4d1-like [Bradysia coprophila]